MGSIPDTGEFVQPVITILLHQSIRNDLYNFSAIGYTGFVGRKFGIVCKFGTLQYMLSQRAEL